MNFNLSQEKIYSFLKKFFFSLGFFSIGASIVLWSRTSPFIILELTYKCEALFIGLWAPTTFTLSLIFDVLIKNIRNRDK